VLSGVPGARSSPILAGDISESDVMRRRVTQSADGSLFISDVESRDTGVYTCRAFNNVGFDTRSVQLVVDGE